MDEWTSPNGVWRIHHPDGWMIENLKSGFGDSPIVYEDGKVAFDHPEQLPEYVKNRFRYMVRYPEDLTGNTPNPDALDELRRIPAFCKFAREHWKEDPKCWEQEAEFGSEVMQAVAKGVCVIGKEPEQTNPPPPKARKPHYVKAQRTRFGMPLGAIIAISAEDLPFVGPDVAYLEVKMRPCAAALHITVTVADIGERP